MTDLLNGTWPRGDIRFVYLHWTAGDYRTVYPSYHVCIGLDDAGAARAFATHDVRANMCDVRATDASYAAHTAGRNSHALGIAICGMRDATPYDFGAFPLRDDMIAVACATTASACAAYAIPIDGAHVRTHAEAACDDGYFGDADDERWDIARLVPSASPLEAADAARTGDLLRARVSAVR